MSSTLSPLLRRIPMVESLSGSDFAYDFGTITKGRFSALGGSDDDVVIMEVVDASIGKSVLVSGSGSGSDASEADDAKESPVTRLGPGAMLPSVSDMLEGTLNVSTDPIISYLPGHIARTDPNPVTFRA